MLWQVGRRVGGEGASWCCMDDNLVVPAMGMDGALLSLTPGRDVMCVLSEQACGLLGLGNVCRTLPGLQILAG
jgi:hypothetical protein